MDNLDTTSLQAGLSVIINCCKQQGIPMHGDLIQTGHTQKSGSFICDERRMHLHQQGTFLICSSTPGQLGHGDVGIVDAAMKLLVAHGGATVDGDSACCYN